MAQAQPVPSTTEPTGPTTEAPKKPKRIDAHYVSHEIQHLFHLEKGFLYTVKELLLRPGKAIREFLFEDRSKLVKPIVFVIFIAVVFTIAMQWAGVQYSLFNVGKIKGIQDNIRAKEIGDWIQGHLGYATLIMSVFIALCTGLVFRKNDYTLFEIFVLISYTSGQSLLLFGSILLAFQLGFRTNPPEFVLILYPVLTITAYFIYPIWAIGQFFGEKNILNYLKATVSFILGLVTYQATFVLIAYLLKLLIPK
jgi:hypothetical protein